MARTLIDDLAEVVILAGNCAKMIVYKVFNIKEKHDLELFFKNAGLKNSAGEVPSQKKIISSETCDSYYMTIPDGLTSNSFFNYKQSLEEKFKQNIEMKYDDGLLVIEMSEKKEVLKDEIE